MTPEERAWKLIEEYKDVMGRSFYGAGSMHPRIAAAIHEAVAAERERCIGVIEAATAKAYYDLRLRTAGPVLVRRIRGEEPPVKNQL